MSDEKFKIHFHPKNGQGLFSEKADDASVNDSVLEQGVHKTETPSAESELSISQTESKTVDSKVSTPESVIGGSSPKISFSSSGIQFSTTPEMPWDKKPETTANQDVQSFASPQKQKLNSKEPPFPQTPAQPVDNPGMEVPEEISPQTEDIREPSPAKISIAKPKTVAPPPVIEQAGKPDPGTADAHNSAVPELLPESDEKTDEPHHGKIHLKMRPPESQSRAERPMPEQRLDEDAVEKEALMKIKLLEANLKQEEKNSGRSGVKMKFLLLPGCLIIALILLFLMGKFFALFSSDAGKGGEQKKKGGVQAFIENNVIQPFDDHNQKLMNEMDEEKKPEKPERKEELEKPAPMNMEQNGNGNKAETDDSRPTIVEEEHTFKLEDGEAASDAEKFRNFLNANPDDTTLQRQLVTYFRRYPDDFQFHRKIIQELTETKRGELAKKYYLEWAEDDPRSYTANMLAAVLFSTPGEAEKYLQRAIGLSRDLETPRRYLIALYEAQRNWRKVKDAASQMSSVIPDDEWALRKEAEAKIRANNGEGRDAAVDALIKHYEERKFTKAQIAVRVLPLTQMLSMREVSEKLLKDLDAASKDNPGLSDALKRFSIHQSLAFGTPLKPEMLGPHTSKETRDAKMLYYVSCGDFSSALMIPIPPEDSPDFWKSFISWYKGEHGWEINSNALREKYQTSTDKTVPLILDFWRGKKTPDEVRELAGTVPASEEALVYFMLAVAAKRNGREPSVKVLSTKAKYTGTGIYETLFRNYLNIDED